MDDLGDFDFMTMLADIDPNIILSDDGGTDAAILDIEKLSSWDCDSDSSGSHDSDLTDNSHRSKEEEKLKRNREAAARCRQKRKFEVTSTKRLVEDLENQLETERDENLKLRTENQNLRLENRSLKEKLISLADDNKGGSLTGVAAFGVVCLFPIFAGSSSAQLLGTGGVSGGIAGLNMVNTMTSSVAAAESTGVLALTVPFLCVLLASMVLVVLGRAFVKFTSKSSSSDLFPACDDAVVRVNFPRSTLLPTTAAGADALNVSERSPAAMRELIASQVKQWAKRVQGSGRTSDSASLPLSR